MEPVDIRRWLDQQRMAEERIAREAAASIPDPSWSFARTQDLARLYASIHGQTAPEGSVSCGEDERVQRAWAALRKHYAVGPT